MAAVGCGPTFSQLDYVRRTLNDAESLLKHASETGQTIDPGVERSVLDARTAFDNQVLDEATTASLLNALAALAKMLAPVTPESLRQSPETGVPPPYRQWAIALAIIIIVYSTISFVTSTIADSIRTDIATANTLAVKLNSEFPSAADQQSGTPPANPNKRDASSNGLPEQLPEGLNRADVIKDLQQYAACVRSIDADARELSRYVHPYKYLLNPASIDPFHSIRNDPDELYKEFELPVPLLNYTDATIQRTITYQKVRYFAQNVADDVTFYYGAVSSCILPVLYALLGAFAYILRTFEQRVSVRTYVPSRADSARFVIAAIGGAVVGLFSDFTTGEPIKVSPLALAFLVGYAVDVFYAFLESLIQSFTKTALSSAGGAPAASTSKPAIPSPAQNSAGSNAVQAMSETDSTAGGVDSNEAAKNAAAAAGASGS